MGSGINFLIKLQSVIGQPAGKVIFVYADQQAMAASKSRVTALMAASGQTLRLSESKINLRVNLSAFELTLSDEPRRRLEQVMRQALRYPY